ncbi:hypothetical protein AB1Y20_006096 [Prymnesium parvum]|uniref:Uncharacterized protein n=1 Tax=Prymnesium parvum TaxID=97485 RepID=A0AB34J2A2_PRYPA
MGAEDLNPTLPADKRWTWRVFAAAWLAMVANPASISAGASLLSFGVRVGEAAAAHLLGGLVLWAALVAAAWPGVQHGIPFPVQCRASFGVLGAHFCTLTRGAVALLWLSFQLWQATLGLHEGILRVGGRELSEWGRINENLTALQLALLLGFVQLHAVAIAIGVSRFRLLAFVSTPIQIAGFGVIVVWLCALCPFDEAIAAANANVSAAEAASGPYANARLLGFLAAVNASVSTWSTLVLNVCDLSRFAPSQKDQVIGQGLGLPLTFTLTGFVGLWGAGATQVAFGHAMWQVPQYFGAWPPAGAMLGALVLAVAILAVNVFANLLSPMNDILNLAPTVLQFRACGYACLCIAVLVCPWWLFSSQRSFVLTFLNGYAIVTGAIAGVLLSDFWVLKRGALDVKALYEPSRCFRRNAIRSNGADDTHSDSQG